MKNVICGSQKVHFDHWPRVLRRDHLASGSNIRKPGFDPWLGQLRNLYSNSQRGHESAVGAVGETLLKVKVDDSGGRKPTGWVIFL